MSCFFICLSLSLFVCVCVGLLFYARGAAEEDERLRRVGFSTAVGLYVLGVFWGVCVGASPEPFTMHPKPWKSPQKRQHP